MNISDEHKSTKNAYVYVFWSVLISTFVLILPPFIMDGGNYLRNEVFQRSGGILVSISIVGLLFEIREPVRDSFRERAEKTRIVIHASLGIIGTLIASFGTLLVR